MMSGIRGKNTKPELTVRKYLHASGFRFRLSPRDLPGRPDIVLPKHGVAIFVHGCFWHRHPGCRFAATPASNVEFWRAKFDVNVARDRLVEKTLTAKDLRVIVVWECELSALHLEALVRRIIVDGNGDVPLSKSNEELPESSV
jgi:DNA mismatch endonuclease (patch repair protein)